MKRALLVLVLVLVLAGCKSVRVVTEYRTMETRDTIYTRDSIYVAKTVHQRGDTIFIFDTLQTFAVVEKIKEVVRYDSVPYPAEVVKEVRKRNGYDRATARGFWVLLSMCTAAVAGWTIKKIIRWKMMR